MLCRLRVLSLSSILMTSSDIFFKVSESSSNILLYSIFPRVLSTSGQFCRICSLIGLLRYDDCIACRLGLVHIRFVVCFYH